jgi:hypothetical protein
MRIWRHLKMLKRTGRGHDPAGIAATKPGECAIECPACPHPDRNLPAGWEKASLAERFFLSVLLLLFSNLYLLKVDIRPYPNH